MSKKGVYKVGERVDVRAVGAKAAFIGYVIGEFISDNGNQIYYVMDPIDETQWHRVLWELRHVE